MAFDFFETGVVSNMAQGPNEAIRERQQANIDARWDVTTAKYTIKEQHDFENGDLVVAIINNDEITIKKVQKSDTGIVLQAFNPHYAPLFFTYSNIENLTVKIIGIVKQLRRKF